MSPEEFALILQTMAEAILEQDSLIFPSEGKQITIPVDRSDFDVSFNVTESNNERNGVIAFRWYKPFEEVPPAEEQKEVIEVESSILFGLQPRMQLNTTTFSSDVGSYLDAFVEPTQSFWNMVIDADAIPANEKWGTTEMMDGIPKIRETKKASSTEATAVSQSISNISSPPKAAIPPPPAKQMKKPPAAVTKPPPTAKAPTTKRPPPAVVASNIKKPPIHEEKLQGGATIIRKPVTSNIPRAKRIDLEEEPEWQEPDPEENVSDDNWVKPSEILKKKGQEDSATIPSPAVDDEPKSSSLKPSDVKKFIEQQERKEIPKVNKKRPEVETKKKKGWAEW